MKISNTARLASMIIKETFDDCAADVTTFLIRKTKSPLRVIRLETKIPTKQVKLFLTVGIQHNFIVVSKHRRGFTQYSVDVGSILQRLRYPSYVYCIKLLYGNVAEVLVEEIIHHGQILHHQLIPRAITKLTRNVKEKVGDSEVVAKLQVLVDARFVELCADPDAQEEDDSGSPSVKRIKMDTSEDKRCYRICNARFNDYHRDLQLVEAITNKLSQKHGEILATMLRLSEVKTMPLSTESAQLTSNEIFNALPKTLNITSRGALEVYMITLIDDSLKMVVKSGDDGGGCYKIDFKQAMTALSIASMDALVLEKFGSKSLRLFRILVMKQHLEQKQLEEMAMIPTRDAKQLLYNMYSKRFVAATEICKTADYAPSRTFYCFKVPVEALAKQLIDDNYKSILNLMCKRIQILADNRRLLDKQQKMEAIIATLNPNEEDQRAEIEAMITPSEKLQLQTVKQQTDRLENGELQLTSTTILWDMYLDYCNLNRFNISSQPKGAGR